LEWSCPLGKTIASLIAFVLALREAPRSGLIIVAGRTLQTIERNLLDPLQDLALFGAVADTVQHTRGSNVATILGRTVHLIGANDARSEGRLRGLTACLGMIDEATLVPKAFFTQFLARLSVPGARLLLTTNPDGPAHWLRKEFIQRAGELDLAHFHFTLDDNPSLAPEYLAAIKAEFTGMWFKRMVLGLWVSAEGAVYDMWDPDRHVIDLLPPIWRWICASVDYGTSNPLHALLLGIDASQTIYVASEWRHSARDTRRSMTDAEYSAELKRWLAEYRQPGHHVAGVTPEAIVVDPSAASFIEQLWRDRMTPTPADNAVADGIRLVSSVLGAGKLKVHRSCKHLIDEFPGYSWDEKKAMRGVDAPIKVDDHGLDAVRYGIKTTEGTWRRPMGVQVPYGSGSTDLDLASAAM
jgi:PBSX family phage terminase large subunit